MTLTYRYTPTHQHLEITHTGPGHPGHRHPCHLAVATTRFTRHLLAAQLTNDGWTPPTELPSRPPTATTPAPTPTAPRPPALALRHHHRPRPPQRPRLDPHRPPPHPTQHPAVTHALTTSTSPGPLYAPDHQLLRRLRTLPRHSLALSHQPGTNSTLIRRMSTTAPGA
ncbi:hypothetical protein ABZX40_39065 [Streptomyces sp. NPDC004610]|uniref:hypothetical protein n=1 Tax=unclassified Streptomyces TaxID=2593676 RepID=UPI0033B64F87